MTEILAENRSKIKRYAAIDYFGHFVEVRHGKRKEPKTTLQALVMDRLREELESQGINPTALGRRAKAMKLGKTLQRTVNDILNGISDPRLGTIHTVSTA